MGGGGPVGMHKDCLVLMVLLMAERGLGTHVPTLAGTCLIAAL